MKCPECDCLEDKVVDTRISKEGDSIRRRRECIGCGHRFTTYEAIMRTELMVVKRDGTREEFSLDKLRSGIQHACWKRPVGDRQIDELVQSVVNRLDGLQEREVGSAKIGNWVMDALKELDEVAFVRFASVYRRFEDVGAFLNEIRNLSDEQAGRD